MITDNTTHVSIVFTIFWRTKEAENGDQKYDRFSSSIENKIIDAHTRMQLSVPTSLYFPICEMTNDDRKTSN